MQESKEREVFLPSIDPEVFRRILQYMYTGELCFRPNQDSVGDGGLEGSTNDRNLKYACEADATRDWWVMELLRGSTFLVVDGLKSECENYLEWSLSVKNVVQRFKVAAELHSEKLHRICVEFMVKHFDEVSALPIFI